jgi:hypothetical protein
VPLANDALILDREIIAEEGLRKALSPDLGVEHARGIEREVLASSPPSVSTTCWRAASGNSSSSARSNVS